MVRAGKRMAEVSLKVSLKLGGSRWYSLTQVGTNPSVSGAFWHLKGLCERLWACS